MKSKKLLRVISEYANIPSESRNEELIRPVIERNMEGHVDEYWSDGLGNLYFLRKGERNGRVILCAHQDKVLNANFEIKIKKKKEEGYEIDSDSKGAQSYFSLIDHVKSFWDGEKLVNFRINCSNIEMILELEKQLTSNYQKYRDGMSSKEISFKETREVYSVLLKQIEEFSIALNENLRLNPVKEGRDYSGKTLLYWPRFSVKEDGRVKGKLDDALGLGIITCINEDLPREESPDLLTIFTVGEEVGFAGSTKAVKVVNKMKERPTRAIVIDTTGCAAPGEGAIIYKSCGNVQFNTKHIADLEESAKRAGINYKAIYPRAMNDSVILAEGLENVATAAIEIPILGMHSARERAISGDIIDTYKLLRAYLKEGDIGAIK